MSSTLEFLHEKGLGGSQCRETLSSWNKTQIVEFLMDFEKSNRDNHLRSANDENDTIFNFAAPADLGGGRTPCEEIRCRLGKIDQLTRFAILYADSIRVVNPVMVGAIGELYDLGELRSRVSDDLEVFSSMEGLIDDGLIKILPSSLAMCSACFPESSELRKRIEVASKAAVKQYLPSIKITRGDESGNKMVYEFTGPEDIFEHGGGYLELNPGSNRLDLRAKTRLVLGYMSQKIDGIFSQDAASDGSAANYLITSEFEAEIFKQLNPKNLNDRSLRLMDGLRHSFPMINSLDINILKEIRDENHDSFAVYRDAITDCLNSADNTSKSALRKVFSNQVVPEVNRLNLAIKNSKSRLSRSIARDFVIASAVVTIGLFGGIVPVGLGGLLAAAGGVNFLRTNAEEIDELVRGSINHQENKYYFLWKVRQAGSR